MTEESTAYDAPDPRATVADRLFADVTTDAEKALVALKTYHAPNSVVGLAMAWNCGTDDVAVYVRDIWKAATFTIANELIRLKGYDGPQDAWRKLGFVWWVENKLRPAECKTMADVLRQYEKGGEPAYVRD